MVATVLVAVAFFTIETAWAKCEERKRNKKKIINKQRAVKRANENNLSVANSVGSATRHRYGRRHQIELQSSPD